MSHMPSQGFPAGKKEITIWFRFRSASAYVRLFSLLNWFWRNADSHNAESWVRKKNRTMTWFFLYFSLNKCMFSSYFVLLYILWELSLQYLARHSPKMILKSFCLLPSVPKCQRKSKWAKSIDCFRWWVSGSVPAMPKPRSRFYKKTSKSGNCRFFQWHMRNIWLEFRLVYKVSDAKV